MYFMYYKKIRALADYPNISFLLKTFPGIYKSLTKKLSQNGFIGPTVYTDC